MKIILIVLTICTQIIPMYAASFYVSSDAKIQGDGSFTNPWQFQTALLHPASLFPGDTVWLRGGVYQNAFDFQTSFSCYTNGTANAPIIFRNYQQERAIIDGQLLYSLYLGLGHCSYTWFWGIEVTNSYSTDRNHDIPGNITCTAENIKFINMIIHDTGSGLDCWKTAKNAEIYGCIIYHIGNNLNNNGNLEGHGHGMYLQNDTLGTKYIHNNIIFSTYGNGIKIWQTTTTAAIGNFDIRHNIVFNGGAASENLGGVGNNSRTHNFFVVANGVNNPITNTTIKHNYTYSGINTPRPPVNAFGLNYGVKNMTLDSNYLTGQTRLGFNNTPIFDASFVGNTIVAGIPPVYGYYLWGFLQTDFPNNRYIPMESGNGLEFFVIPNKYEEGRAHIAIYNWDTAAIVKLDISNIGLKPGDAYEIINVMDYFQDIIRGTFDSDGNIEIPMTGHTFANAVGSSQKAVSQFPQFGAFVIRKSIVKISDVNTAIDYEMVISPNPSSGKMVLNGMECKTGFAIYNMLGNPIFTENNASKQSSFSLDLSDFPKGMYLLKNHGKNTSRTYKILIE